VILAILPHATPVILKVTVKLVFLQKYYKKINVLIPVLKDSMKLQIEYVMTVFLIVLPVQQDLTAKNAKQENMLKKMVNAFLTAEMDTLFLLTN
jgi:hypothetical protein